MDTTAPSLNEVVRTNVRVVLARQDKTGPQLATMLGVAPTWVWRRLNGSIGMSLDDLFRIAKALDVSVPHLVTPGGDE